MDGVRLFQAHGAILWILLQDNGQKFRRLAIQGLLL